jgi:hypothetical protein
LAAADRCYSPSFIPYFFFKSIIGNSIALDAETKMNTMDKAQGTVNLAKETNIE